MYSTAKASPPVRSARGVVVAGGGAAVPLLVQLLAELALPALVEQVGHEQLVDDEEQDDEAAGDEELAHRPGDGAPPGRATARRDVRGPRNSRRSVGCVAASGW